MALQKKHRARRGILVLESPWELDERDGNRSSVLPFIEGVAKLVGDTEVYYANFYDKKSFEQALNCLCKTQFDDTIIYIAAHGYGRKVTNMNIDHMLSLIGIQSRKNCITGVILGSCFVGGNTSIIEMMTTGTNIRWCSGYASSTWWLPATLIDCSIITHILDRKTANYSDRDKLISTFSQAIACFDKNSIIGDDVKDRPVQLKDSLQFIVQPEGKGYRPRTISSEVFAESEEEAGEEV